MPSRNHRGRVALAAALLLAATAVGCTNPDPVADQQAQVADRGAEVMPFDLDATTHTFSNTTTVAFRSSPLTTRPTSTRSTSSASI